MSGGHCQHDKYVGGPHTFPFNTKVGAQAQGAGRSRSGAEGTLKEKRWRRRCPAGCRKHIVW